MTQFSSPPPSFLAIISSMSSKPTRRATIVDRLKKVLKPTRSNTLPARSSSSPSASKAVESQPAPASRMYPLENKSEGNVARKWSFAKSNKSSTSLGQRPQPSRTKGGRWFIPNETTIFPLPAPTHPAFRSQPISPISPDSPYQPISPISPTQEHVRRPSLSTSASSHGTSDLHTPKSAIENRPPPLWIPKSDAITPGYDQTTAFGYGFSLSPYDMEARVGPEFSPAPSGKLFRPSVDTRHRKPSNLELRSPGWICKEVEAIQDEEMRRLTEMAFM